MSSSEGTTQGDPLAMPWYAIATTTLISNLRKRVADAKQAWLADDAAAAGSLRHLQDWYEALCDVGVNSGYHVNRAKIWLILKDSSVESRAKALFGDAVQLTTEGQRHLGAVIGSVAFKEEYCGRLALKWQTELCTLADIATTKPHEAHVAFTKGYKSKFTYFMRNIPDISDMTLPTGHKISSKYVGLS